jgi:outer membrane protein assembly factor BamB
MKTPYSTVIFLLLCSAAVAADWPVFRGDQAQDGVSPDQLPDQLEEIWQFKTGKSDGSISIENAPAIVDGVVYLPGQDQVFYALALADGAEKWRFKSSAPFKTSPAVRKNRIYVGDVDGNFYCLDAANANPVWKFQCDQEITSGPGFAGDKVMFGSADESLYCLDDKGKKLWQFQVPGGPVLATPAVEKNLTFVSGCDSKLHVIDTDKGGGIAEIDLDGQTGATPSLRGGFLYVGTMSNQVKAINIAKKEVAWTFDTRNYPVFASTAVTDELVIAGCRDRHVYALERATGKPKWDFVTGNRIEGSPVVVGSRVYVGSMDKNLYVVDLAKGTEIQRLKLDSGVTGSIAVSGGRLLVGTQNGTLYCFGKK